MAAAAPRVPLHDSVKHSFQITSADGTPLAIPPGEYYFNTKARARRMMQNSLSSEARQVYAYLELHTMGFRREDAVVKDNDQLRWATTTDIEKDTGLQGRNVRRALDELDREGLAKRSSDDGGPLRKGHVRICSWAKPRKTAGEDSGHARPESSQFPDWFPESWESLKPLIKRLRVTLDTDLGVARDLILEEGEQIARDLEEAEKRARALLERVRAHPRINKEERTDRTEEKEREEEEPLRPPPPPPLVRPDPPTPEPETALVPVDPRRELAWESLRATFDGCGKPISVLRAADCREEFFKHSLEGQLFIAQDATIRAQELWNELKWTPDPLKYLKSQVWKTEPVKRRTLRPTAQSAKQQRDDALRRLMERAEAYDRENGRKP